MLRYLQCSSLNNFKSYEILLHMTVCQDRKWNYSWVSNVREDPKRALLFLFFCILRPISSKQIFQGKTLFVRCWIFDCSHRLLFQFDNCPWRLHLYWAWAQFWSKCYLWPSIHELFSFAKDSLWIHLPPKKRLSRLDAIECWWRQIALEDDFDKNCWVKLKGDQHLVHREYDREMKFRIWWVHYWSLATTL